MNGFRCRMMMAVAMLGAMSAIFPAAPSPAQSPRDWDLRYIDALRDQRLLWLAERVARRRMASASSARDAAQWAVELVRTLAARAIDAPDAQQDKAWSALHEVARTFQRKYPRSAWRWQVDLQVALAEVARARSLQLEAALAGAGSGERDRALRVVREARKMLRNLVSQLDRVAGTSSRNEDAMPAAVLQSLQNQAALAESRLLVVLGTLYPSGSDDRIAALDAAVKRTDEVLAGTQQADALRSDALLLRATALRTLGDRKGAARTLQVVQQQKGLSPTFRLRVDAERLRLAIAQPDPPARWPVRPEVGRSIAGVTHVEWDMAALEALLAGAGRGKERRDKLVQRIEEGVEWIAQRYGPYWGRRAARLLARRVADWGGGGSGALLAKSAMERRREGNAKAAIELLEQAAQAFLQAGDKGRAFECRYQSGLIFQEVKQYRRASDQLRETSLEFRDDPRAAAAHLLAIWDLGRVLGKAKDESPEYLTWLDEQIAVWPKAVATQRARWWLAEWLERRGRQDEALTAYARIEATSELRSAADLAAWRLWWWQLDQRPRDSKKRPEVLRKAAAYFGELSRAARENAAWEAACRASAMEIAFESLVDPLVPAAHWQTLEQARTERQRSAPGQSGCEAMEVWLRANLMEDAAWPDELPASVDFHWLRWAVERWRFAARSKKTVVAADAAQLLQAIESFEERHPKQSESSRNWLHLSQAELLTAAGRRGEARKLLESLARKYRRDYAIQRAWAAWLLQSADRDDHRLAEQAWRRLAAMTRPGTAAWWEAKYGVAQSLFRQAKRTECADRILYLQATRAPLPEPWGERFRVLLEKCR